MGKLSKVLVCGQVACGKTALLEQLIYGNHIVGAVSKDRHCLDTHMVFQILREFKYIATIVN